MLQSCSSWTARLSRLLKNDGRYLKKLNICHLVELEKTYLLKKKVNLERTSLDKDVSKILRGSLFLGHPLFTRDKINIFIF